MFSDDDYFNRVPYQSDTELREAELRSQRSRQSTSRLIQLLASTLLTLAVGTKANYPVGVGFISLVAPSAYRLIRRRGENRKVLPVQGAEDNYLMWDVRD